MGAPWVPHTRAPGPPAVTHPGHTHAHGGCVRWEAWEGGVEEEHAGGRAGVQVGLGAGTVQWRGRRTRNASGALPLTPQPSIPGQKHKECITGNAAFNAEHQARWSDWWASRRTHVA